MSGRPSTAPEAIAVRYNGVLFGLSLLPFVALLGGPALLFPPIQILFGIPAFGFAAAMLLLIGGSFDRRPLLVLEPEGVRLPCAGDLLLGYGEIEAWAEKVRSNRSWDTYWTFSLQCRPRLFLDLSWWAWLRFVRVNTLTGGDLLLESRFISCHPEELAALIQARIDLSRRDEDWALRIGH